MIGRGTEWILWVLHKLLEGLRLTVVVIEEGIPLEIRQDTRKGPTH